MPSRDWQSEVHQNLAEEARREASIFWNTRLARRYIERGAGLALVFVLTWYVSSTTLIAVPYRQAIFTISVVAAMAAASLMLIGVVGLAFRHKDAGSPQPQRPGEPPPIGW
jgi:hypothetical protein